MDLDKYRQVISEAINGEIEAKIFYTQVSEKIKDNNLKDLFLTFAKEEEKHEQILNRVLKNEKMDTTYFNCDKDFNVAQTIDMPEVNSQMNLKDAIGIAMKNEEAAMMKYQSLADNCDDEDLKSVFLDLAAMEKNHKFKMETSFVDVAYPEIW